MSKKHMMIPDCQITPQTDPTYLKYIGMYAAEKKPDVIVCIGDFADLPSLSSYDVGKKSFEGRCYLEDVEATKRAMAVLLAPIREEQARLKRNKEKQWKPRMIMTLGNHENRINRVVNDDRKLEGTFSVEQLGYTKSGWEVYPFLQPVVVDGICYSHYFASGVKNLPVTTAAALLSKKHMSCVAGHQQGRQIAYGERADGRHITAIISGSCYEDYHDYMGPQGNNKWTGIWMFHNVEEGSFDEMPVPLDYLKKKYSV